MMAGRSFISSYRPATTMPVYISLIDRMRAYEGDGVLVIAASLAAVSASAQDTLRPITIGERFTMRSAVLGEERHLLGASPRVVSRWQVPRRGGTR